MRKLTIPYLVIVLIIIIMPMLLHNNIVETIEASSDMKAHVSIIEGNNHNVSYLGQTLLKWLFHPLADSENLRTYYMVFNFVVLITVFYTLFFVTKAFFNLQSAFITPILSLFVSTNILGLFKYGVIFNIINVYIILPIALYNLVKWFTDNKLRNGIVGLSLLGLFSVFHYSGYYIIAFIVLSLIGYTVYGLVKHKWWQWKKVLVLFLISLLGFIYMITKNAWLINFDFSPLTNLQYIFLHLSPVTFVLLVSGLVYFKKNKIGLKDNGKLFLYSISCICITLLGALAFLEITDFNRVVMDFAGMITILTGCLIGVVCSYGKKFVNYLVYGLIIVGAILNITMWVS